MTLGLDGILERVGDDAEVDLEKRIVREQHSSAIEQIQGCRVSAAAHLAETVVHEPAPVIRTLLRYVGPERFVVAPDLVALPRRDRMSADDCDRCDCEEGAPRFR